MTEPITYDRAPEEIVATVAKLEAEARRANADAAKREAEVETELLHQQADVHRLWTESHESMVARMSMDTFLYGDHANRVYRIGGEITSKTAGECLQQISRWARENDDPIEVVIASSGGEILPGLALFDHLQVVGRQLELTTGCLGVAASMAGVLLQAGNHRWMGRQAHIMIHRAAFAAAGKAFEVEDQTEFVNKLERQIARIYAERSHLSEVDVLGIFEQRKDRWIGADEALELGLVDEVR